MHKFGFTSNHRRCFKFQAHVYISCGLIACVQLFKTMLHKKMSARPSNANAGSSRKYYLEDKPSGRRMIRDRPHDEEDDDKGSDSFKWDKTDTDCKDTVSFFWKHQTYHCDELDLPVGNKYRVNEICYCLQSLFWRFKTRATSSRSLYGIQRGKLHENPAIKCTHCLVNIFQSFFIAAGTKICMIPSVWRHNNPY